MERNQSGRETNRDALVRRATAAEAVQHAATLLPLAVCIGSGLYLFLLSPVLGGGGAALGLVVVSGVGAAGSYFYHYNRDYPRVARELTDRLELDQVRAEETALAQLADRIRAGLLSVNSTEGIQTIAGLTASYAQLQASLVMGRSTDALSVALVPALAGEAYRRGLDVLAEALELMKVLYNPTPAEAQGVLWPPDGLPLLIASPTNSRERIGEEIGRLEAEIETLKSDPAKTDHLSLKQEMLASARGRLAMLDKLQFHIDRLVHQARRCESSLRDAQVELAAVRASGSKTSVDAVIESNQFTIRQAKEVQDELDGLGR